MNLPFTGFPERAESTPVPNIFFNRVIPQIKDINELKTTLHIFWLIYHKRGFPRFVTLTELLSDTILISNIEDNVEITNETIRLALNSATQRGTILNLTVQKGNQIEEVYFLNTPADRKIVNDVRQGRFELSGLKLTSESLKSSQPTDIFNLYEQNIGMLTPMIAEELREAERLYPKDWIQSAFKEAVTLNKRNWKYISRILERWTTEGKDGKFEGDFKKETDPDKYIRGKYGRLVKR